MEGTPPLAPRRSSRSRKRKTQSPRGPSRSWSRSRSNSRSKTPSKIEHKRAVSHENLNPALVLSTTNNNMADSSQAKIDNGKDGLQFDTHTNNKVILYENENITDMKYVVLVDLNLPESDDNRKKRIYELKLYDSLKTLNLLKGYVCLKRIGFRRCKVEFKTAEDANNLVQNNSSLKSYFLRAFIPITFVYKFGVVKEIPKKMSEEELSDPNIMISEIPIRSVQKFTRIYENKVIPTNTIKIGFLGNAIPRKVLILGIPFKVDYYVPRPKSCERCGRLGHLKGICKSSKPRCLKCGRDSSICQNLCNQDMSKKCILCEGTDHDFTTATTRNCWRKREQQDYQRIMAIGNLTFNEVREKHTVNSFDLLTDQEFEIEFPDMTTKNQTKQIHNNQDEINKTLRRHASYKKVVTKKPTQNISTKQFPTVEPIDYGNQCVFNFQLDKVTEFEKVVNSFFSHVLKNAEITKNDSLKELTIQAKALINKLSINNDLAMVESSQNNNNGKNTPT